MESSPARRRVGLFGGSFNPPHAGHEAVADQAARRAGLHVLYWMPAPRPPHKAGRALASFEHRLAMVRLAVAGDDRFRASGLEGRREGPSYTVDTLRALRELEGEDAELHLVVGGDSVLELATWHRVEDILAQARLVVAPRPGSPFALEALRPRGVSERGLASLRRGLVLDTSVDVSASGIREQVARGASLAGLLRETVAAYIAEHGLYRAPSFGAGGRGQGAPTST